MKINTIKILMAISLLLSSLAALSLPLPSNFSSTHGRQLLLGRKHKAVNASDNIVIIFAMEEEAKPFIKKERMVIDSSIFSKNMPAEAYHSKKNSRVWAIVSKKDKRYRVSSVGTQVAAIMTWESIKKLRPEFIISAGTAGGFKSHGSKIADIYLSDGEINYFSRRITGAGYQQYGEGHYCSYDSKKIARVLSLKTGHVVTGDSFDLSRPDLKNINQLNGDIKDMEAASEAQICSYTNTKFMAIKVISDLVDIPQPGESQFHENFSKATSNLSVALIKVINILASRAGGSDN